MLAAAALSTAASLLSSSSASGGGAAADCRLFSWHAVWARGSVFGMSSAERRVSTTGKHWRVVRSGGCGGPSSAAVGSPPPARCAAATTTTRSRSCYGHHELLRPLSAVAVPSTVPLTVAVRFRRRSLRAVAPLPERAGLLDNLFLLVASHRHRCQLHRPRRPAHRRACSTSS